MNASCRPEPESDQGTDQVEQPRVETEFEKAFRLLCLLNKNDTQDQENKSSAVVHVCDKCYLKSKIESFSSLEGLQDHYNSAHKKKESARQKKRERKLIYLHYHPTKPGMLIVPHPMDVALMNYDPTSLGWKGYRAWKRQSMGRGYYSSEESVTSSSDDDDLGVKYVIPPEPKQIPIPVSTGLKVSDCDTSGKLSDCGMEADDEDDEEDPLRGGAERLKVPIPSKSYNDAEISSIIVTSITPVFHPKKPETADTVTADLEFEQNNENEVLDDGDDIIEVSINPIPKADSILPEDHEDITELINLMEQSDGEYELSSTGEDSVQALKDEPVQHCENDSVHAMGDVPFEHRENYSVQTMKDEPVEHREKDSVQVMEEDPVESPIEDVFARILSTQLALGKKAMMCNPDLEVPKNVKQTTGRPLQFYTKEDLVQPPEEDTADLPINEVFARIVNKQIAQRDGLAKSKGFEEQANGNVEEVVPPGAKEKGHAATINEQMTRLTALDEPKDSESVGQENGSDKEVMSSGLQEKSQETGKKEPVNGADTINVSSGRPSDSCNPRASIQPNVEPVPSPSSAAALSTFRTNTANGSPDDDDDEVQILYVVLAKKRKTEYKPEEGSETVVIFKTEPGIDLGPLGVPQEPGPSQPKLATKPENDKSKTAEKGTKGRRGRQFKREKVGPSDRVNPTQCEQEVDMVMRVPGTSSAATIWQKSYVVDESADLQVERETTIIHPRPSVSVPTKLLARRAPVNQPAKKATYNLRPRANSTDVSDRIRKRKKENPRPLKAKNTASLKTHRPNPQPSKKGRKAKGKHPGISHNCSLCDTALTAPMQILNNSRTVPLTLCQTCTNNFGHFEIQIKSSYKSKLFKCSCCGKEDTTKTKALEHMKTYHATEKPRRMRSTAMYRMIDVVPFVPKIESSSSSDEEQQPEAAAEVTDSKKAGSNILPAGLLAKVFSQKLHEKNQFPCPEVKCSASFGREEELNTHCKTHAILKMVKKGKAGSRQISKR